MYRQGHGGNHDGGSTSLRRLVLAPVLAAGFLLVGCGGGDDPSVTTDGDAAAASAEGSTEAAAGATGDATEAEGSNGGGQADDSSATQAERDPSVGPLEALLGFGGDPEEMAADQLEQMRKGEEMIAECMRAEGFEYTPFVPDNAADFMSVDFDESDRDVVAEQGFGMSTTFGDAYSETALGEENPDPNQGYVESLSEADQEAYYRTLYGDMPDFGEEPLDGEDEDMTAFEPSGCQGEAFKEQFAQFAVFEEYGDDLDTMFERFSADPRIVELDQKWAECMRTAGYEYTNPESMWDDVSGRMDSLFESSDPMTAELEAMSEEEFNALTDTEKEAVFAPPVFDEEKLAEVQTYEKAVALANFDCSEGEKGERLEIQHEYEQLFIDENPAILEAGS